MGYKYPLKKKLNYALGGCKIEVVKSCTIPFW